MDEILPIRRKLYTINLLENVYRVWHKITFITIKVSNVCHWNSTYLQEPVDEHMDGSIKSYLSEKKYTMINSQSKFNMYWRSSQFYLSCNFYIVGIPLQKMTIQYNTTMNFSDKTVCRLRLRPIGLLLIVYLFLMKLTCFSCTIGRCFFHNRIKNSVWIELKSFV